MSEHIVDLTQVEKVEGLGDLDTYTWLTALPVREEIVRCKDCKYLDRKDYTKTHKVPITGSWCNWFADTCEQDGYCKWGEKRCDE